MTNPNPNLITSPMWRLWTDRPESSWRLGGIFANKSGYHNTVAANLLNWPNNYSIRFNLDLNGIRDKARAIDYTMSDAHMRLYTGRLVAAADRNDPRMKGVREFYGTTDSRFVTGRIRDNDFGGYRTSTADSSHLWHIHISVWATYVNNWSVLRGIISILSGQTQEEFMTFCKQGDSGEAVRKLQGVLVYTFDQDLGEFGPDNDGVDGDYGGATSRGLRNVIGTSGTVYNAKEHGMMLDRLHGGLSRSEVEGIISNWVDANRDRFPDVNWDNVKAEIGIKVQEIKPTIIERIAEYVQENIEPASPSKKQVREAVADYLDTHPDAIQNWLEENKEALRGPVPEAFMVRMAIDSAVWSDGT